MLLPLLRFDPLRSALFLNAGLVLVALFLVEHTLPPEPNPFAAHQASLVKKLAGVSP